MQAWEEIYASQYMRLVTLMTRSVAEAEEAVQEAFARGLACRVGDHPRTIRPPGSTDLDGVPGPELVTTLECSADKYPQLVALRVGAGGELSVLGYVLPPHVHHRAEVFRYRIVA